MTRRVCPVKDCDARTPPRRLMCSVHWRLVSREHLANLYHALLRHGLRSVEYADASRAAIDDAERREAPAE